MQVNCKCTESHKRTIFRYFDDEISNTSRNALITPLVNSLLAYLKPCVYDNVRSLRVMLEGAVVSSMIIILPLWERKMPEIPAPQE